MSGLLKWPYSTTCASLASTTTNRKRSSDITSIYSAMRLSWPTRLSRFYLQSILDDGSSQCALVMAKTRLAPRKPMTMPRLELMAALIPARASTYILVGSPSSEDRQRNTLHRLYRWCTVERPSRWKRFVYSRVTRIQRVSGPSEWIHIDGTANIADFATRGVTAEQLGLVGRSDLAGRSS